MSYFLIYFFGCLYTLYRLHKITKLSEFKERLADILNTEVVGTSIIIVIAYLFIVFCWPLFWVCTLYVKAAKK